MGWVASIGSFLINLAMTTVGMVIMTGLIGSFSSSGDPSTDGLGTSPLLDWITGLFPSGQTQEQTDRLDTGISIIAWCIDLIAMVIECAAYAGDFGTTKDLAWGFLCLIMAAYATGAGNILVDVLVTVVSGMLFAHSILELMTSSIKCDKYAAMLSVFVSLTATTISLYSLGRDMT